MAGLDRMLNSVKGGESVLYVTLEESADGIRENMNLEVSIEIIDALSTGSKSIFGNMLFKKLT